MDDWEEYVVLLPVRIVGGEKAQGPVMRRRVGDDWEYRAMTTDEEANYVSRDAW